MNMTVRTIKTDAQTYSPAQKEQAQKCNVPIYLYPGAYAQRHGEIEEYRASRQANIACRDAIDAAIREHFRDNVLSKKAVQSVIGQYGDGRISQSNRNWAKMQPIFADPDDRGNERNRAFVVRAHPGLTDLFLREVRHEKAASLEKKMPQMKKQKSEMER